MEPSKRPVLRFPAAASEKPLTALQRLAQESTSIGAPKPIRTTTRGPLKRELETAMDLTDNVPPPMFEPSKKERRITKLSHVKGSTPQRLSKMNSGGANVRPAGASEGKVLSLDDLHRAVLSVDFSDIDSSTSVEIDDPYPRLSFDTLELYKQRQSQVLLTETMEGFRQSLQVGFSAIGSSAGGSGMYSTLNVSIATVVRKGRDFCLLTLAGGEGVRQDVSLTQGDVVLLLKPQHDILDVILKRGFTQSVASTLLSEKACLFGIVEKNSERSGKGAAGGIQVKCPMASASFPFGYSPSDAGTVGSEFVAVIVHSLLTVEREWRALCWLTESFWFTRTLLAGDGGVKRSLKPRESLVEQLLKTKLNESQRDAVEAAAGAAAGSVVSVQGPPGTGKTHTLVTLLTVLRSRGVKRVIVCAPSNAAVDELMLRFLVKTGLLKSQPGTVLRIGRGSTVADLKQFSLDHIVAESQSQIETERYAQFQQRKDKLFADIAQINAELQTATGQRRPELNRTKERVKQQLDQLKLRADESTKVGRDSVYEKYLASCQFLFGTLSAFGSEAVLNNTKSAVDVCVIDEAAQAIEVASLIPLQYQPARLVLVGDPQQLPAVVKSAAAKRARFDLSLMERLELSGSVRSHMLKEQYRMDPEIALFPSKQFYDSRLVTADCVVGRRSSVATSLLGAERSVVFIDTHASGDIRQGTSMINAREGRLAADLARLLVSHGITSIGVISPYRQQVMLIRNLLTSVQCADLEVDSVDAFQGREKEVIIFSCVRSGGADHSVGFLADQRRLNVAITRAKRALWLIGNVGFLDENGGPVWSNLVSHCKATDSVVDASDIDHRMDTSA